MDEARFDSYLRLALRVHGVDPDAPAHSVTSDAQPDAPPDLPPSIHAWLQQHWRSP